ncbi:ATP-binding protein [Pelagibacterium nitratireducens]|uniref:ATP-binding protein n=1 Tax=Pelagibacterium nitratireducens TaxID=1046114 RepID=A0ABZ2I0E4_9HYPH
MSRLSVDIYELTDAALAADYTRVRRVANRLAQFLMSDDEDGAKKIRSLLRRKGVPLRASGYAETLPVDTKSRAPLVEEQDWPTTPLFLNGDAAATFSSFIDDVQNSELLSKMGLTNRQSLLLSGPPGTGKSLIAGHIASQIGRPLYVVRLDAVISSLLGDTAKNIRNVFDYVPGRDGVLFLDEMDAVAKMRDDKHELGELKRVVNTVIQGLDSLDDRAVVIGATNHAQLLDPAIFRRFPYRIEVGLPDEEVRSSLWRHFLLNDADLDKVHLTLGKISDGLTGADIQNIAWAVRRNAVLDSNDLDIAAVAYSVIQRRRSGVGLPSRGLISSEAKREAANILVGELKLSGAEAARLLGVSRQAVAAYLKD